MAGCCLRFMIIFISFVCMISALVDVAVGVIAKSSNLLPGGFILEAVTGVSSTFWLVVGTATEVIAVFGCCSLCFNSHPMVLTYGILMLLLSGAKIVMGFLLLTSPLPYAEELSHDSVNITAVWLGHSFGTGIVMLLGAIMGFAASRQIQRKDMMIDMRPLIPSILPVSVETPYTRLPSEVAADSAY